MCEDVMLMMMTMMKEVGTVEKKKIGVAFFSLFFSFDKTRNRLKKNIRREIVV